MLNKEALSGRLSHFKLFEKSLLIFWIILTFLIAIYQSNIEYGWLQIVIHLILISLLFIVVPWLNQREGKLWRFIRYWYFIICLPLLYKDVGNFLHLVTPMEFDPYILAIEEYIFGVLPNIWIQNYINPFFTEIMQISYSIYWITIPLGAAIFYADRRLDLFEYLLYYVSIAFFISYIAFIFIPVAGPRFFIAEKITAEYKGFILTDILREFMRKEGYRGGAFPSSHVGVAVTILVIFWHFRPRIARNLFLPLVTALSLATFYGQYHYFTDVVAGLIMGLCIGFWGANQIKKNIAPIND